MKKVLFAALALLAAGLAPVGAQEAEEMDRGHEKELEDVHTVGVFLGVTTRIDEKSGESFFSLAAEYEYSPKKWGGKWGVAAVVEVIFTDDTDYLLLPLAYYHPREDFFFRFGPGLEVTTKDSGERTNHLLLRFGVGYIIEAYDFLLIPSFDLDGIRKHPAVIYGVVIAKDL